MDGKENMLATRTEQVWKSFSAVWLLQRSVFNFQLNGQISQNGPSGDSPALVKW